MEAGNGKCKANNKDKEEAGVKMKACEEKGKEGMEDSKNDPTMENQSPCSVSRAELMKRAKEAEWDAKGAVVDAQRAVVNAELVAKRAAVDAERAALRVKRVAVQMERAVDDLEWADDFEESDFHLTMRKSILEDYKYDLVNAKRAEEKAKHAVEHAERAVEDAKRAVEDREQAAAEAKLQAAEAKLQAANATWEREQGRKWLEKRVEVNKKWEAECKKQKAEDEIREAEYKEQDAFSESLEAWEKVLVKLTLEQKIMTAMERDVRFRKAMEERSATKRKEAKITEARNRVAKVAAKMARNDELLAVCGEARVILMGQQAEVGDALGKKEI